VGKRKQRSAASQSKTGFFKLIALERSTPFPCALYPKLTCQCFWTNNILNDNGDGVRQLNHSQRRVNDPYFEVRK
jgi:hypothetical protein